MHYVGPKGFWARGSKKYCHLSTGHITAAFNTAPPETMIILYSGSENTFISAASRSASLLILQQGFAMGWGRILPTQMTVASWQLRPKLHWLLLEPTVQFSLLAFSFLSAAQLSFLNKATTIRCRRKYWTREEWTKCTFQSIVNMKMALPGNWSARATGHKELYCPRLHVCLKSFHQRLEVKGQYSCLSNS